MAKAPVNADALLAGLLGNLDKGIVSVKPQKEKKVKLQDEATKTYRLSKASLESKYIVLVVNMIVCKCGKVYESPNAYPLVEKVDKWGNMHRTRFILQSEINDLPRLRDTVWKTCEYCSDCMERAELKPNVSEEAKHVEEVDLDKLVEGILGSGK